MYASHAGLIIAIKTEVKNLGVHMDCDCNFTRYTPEVIKRVRNQASWSLHSSRMQKTRANADNIQNVSRVTNKMLLSAL